MKKAVIVLYVLFAVQSFIVFAAFIFGAYSMKAAFRHSHESMLEVCDQRYLQK